MDGMSDGAPSREQRLAFGRVAEQYERARPSYPAAAIDEVLAYAGVEPGEPVVEVGAGTGKATRLLTARGLRVLAIEPDPAMAAICARASDPALVEVQVTDFESWRPREHVGLLLSAQAWHWLDPQLRWRRAAEALRRGGAVAALWTLPVWERIPLRAALDEVYAATVPEMAPGFPLHPASRPERLAERWHEEVAEGFADVRAGTHDWTQRYGASEYAELIATHQDHIRLETGQKGALLDRVRGTIERDGGTIEMAYRTSVCMARRIAGGEEGGG
jgi:SAM-dependent methyltransferase